MENQDAFVYGVLCGVILISILLATQFGDDFHYLHAEGLTLLPTMGEGLNWKTAIMLCLALALFYGHIHLNDEAALPRLFYAAAYLAFAWSIYDSVWILRHAVRGHALFGEPLSRYVPWTALVRQIAIFTVAGVNVWRVRHSFHVRCAQVYWAWFAWAVYWAYLFFPLSIPLLYNTFFFQFFNLLPWLVMLKEGTGLSWKKFLYF